MSDLFIDKFATDDALVNECRADHVTVGMSLFEDVLVLKERIAELEQQLNKLEEVYPVVAAHIKRLCQGAQ